MASTVLEAWPSARPSLDLPWRNLRDFTAIFKARRQSGVREKQISTTAPELKNKVSVGKVICIDFILMVKGPFRSGSS